MTRGLTQLAKLSLAGAFVISACGDATVMHEASGSVTLPLTTDAGGIQYRLRDAVFDVVGPTSATLRTEDDPDATRLQMELRTGSYDVALRDGWRLERGDRGEFQTVEAELLTENPLLILIEREASTSATFRFATAGTPIGPEPPANLVDVFGFEDAALWASSAQLSSSDLRVQALRSLAVRGGGFRLISSVPVGGFELTGNTVAVAIRLPLEQPNVFWFGNLELIVDAPSVGLVNHSVGGVGLTGLPLGQFVDLEFPLSQSALDALGGDFDDMVVRLALNVPVDALGTYRLDNLRLGGVSACGQG